MTEIETSKISAKALIEGFINRFIILFKECFGINNSPANVFASISLTEPLFELLRNSIYPSCKEFPWRQQ